MVAMGNLVTAFIGLGANVGRPHQALTNAVVALGALPGTSVDAVSRLYRTRPVGPVEQADFLNAVVAIRVLAAPSPEDGAMALLIALKDIERALGRVQRGHWGPREVDLDLLLYGGHRLRVARDIAARSDDPARDEVQWLEVPHPLASGRLFVLEPLADLAPALEPPGWGMSVEHARDRARATEGPDAAVPVTTWDEARQRWAAI
jgi:2-amino-4-hydroxy-6-hydroxymethyldihydropteridine diphosphokinase